MAERSHNTRLTKISLKNWTRRSKRGDPALCLVKSPKSIHEWNPVLLRPFDTLLDHTINIPGCRTHGTAHLGRTLGPANEQQQ